MRTITSLFLRLGNLVNSPANITLVGRDGLPPDQVARIEPHAHHAPLLDAHHAPLLDGHHHQEENPDAPFLTHDDAHDHPDADHHHDDQDGHHDHFDDFHHA